MSINYTVNKGDTLNKIAQKFSTTSQALAQFNGISNPNLIKVGQVLKIPFDIPEINSLLIKKFNSAPITDAGNNNSNNAQIKIVPDNFEQQVHQHLSNIRLNYKFQFKNTKVLEALKNSPWKSKSDSLGVAYNVLKDCGYSNECAIGLMANLVEEGDFGLVEYSFSKSHNFGFHLPSGGIICKTIKDIKYVRDWSTKEKTGKLKKGSCGFGSVQWSFERRVSFANVCLSIMKRDEDVNNANWAMAEATFISQELKNEYYSKVEKAAKGAGGSVEAWAEAFTDFYERPAHCDGKMNATGQACIKRRKNARDIYEYLKNNNALA